MLALKPWRPDTSTALLIPSKIIKGTAQAGTGLAFSDTSKESSGVVGSVEEVVMVMAWATMTSKRRCN
jgi:hypothetical protein